MSTKPGVTTRPVASMVSAASPSSPGSSPVRLRTSTIRPSLTPMSARYRSAPVPSTTVPPVIFRSNIVASSDQTGRVENPGHVSVCEVFHPRRRGMVGERAHVPVVLPQRYLSDCHPVHRDELQDRGFPCGPVPFLVVLVHDVRTVG